MIVNIVTVLLLCSTLVCAQSIPDEVRQIESDLAALKQQIATLKAQVDLPSYVGPVTAGNKPNGGGIILNNAKGVEIIGMAPDKNSDGSITIYRSTGDLGVELRSSYTKAYNATGQRVAFIGTSTADSGLVQISRADGTLAVNISIEGIEVNGRNLGDVAEWFDCSAQQAAIPGTVMTIVKTHNEVVITNRAYDHGVIGVVSGAGLLNSAITIGRRDTSKSSVPIAIAGQVYVRVNAEGGEIKPGDLLVSSDEPGIAMKLSVRKSRQQGTIIGKSLETFKPTTSQDHGLIRMLVMPQ